MDFEVFTQTFMLRAFYGGILIAILGALLGTFVTLRKQSFLADGVAHASLAGIAVGIIAGFEPLLGAVLVAILMAVLMTYSKKRSSLSSDAVIGIFYSILFATGILIISLSPGYRPELTSFLFGSLLAISTVDLFISTIFTLIILFFIGNYYPQLVYSTFDREGAKVRGVRVDLLDYLFNIAVSVAIVIALKLVGIILVTALFVIPASSAKVLARNFGQMLPISVIFSVVMVVGGIVASYFVDAPVGASIVVLGGLGFGLVTLVRGL